MRAGLQDSLDNGLTLEQFRRQMTQKLTQKGWLADKAKLVADEDGVLEGKQLTPRRLRTIFETNMQSSYGAGRYTQQMENAADRPYWTRVAVMDLRTRPAHAALNGLTARYDDPIWQFAYPPTAGDAAAASGHVRKAISTARASPSGRARGIWKPCSRHGGRRIPARCRRSATNGQLYTPDAGFGHNPGQAGWRVLVNA
ncbi:phage head morphogenesis protein, SPP1 gp7 family [Klebsiella pneumoniae]|uniref:Phage head morphogenesis protein, SPP1 gp7 family n=1 Tax=Klebsiella pneumoniae TaxID=573 RepID=A0A377XWR9_KLEPN|nr:phage head morphogenesis protein, SPP1 gp7 family [Klebsiella pneumoniae]